HPSVVLPVVGGHVYQQAQSFNANGLSFKNAHTEVNGSFDEDHNLYTTYAVSVVEQLNIADIVTADRVVSRMAVYSPEKTASGEHSFDITGSYFENLRIAGNAVDVKLATHRLHQIDTFSKFEAAYHSDELRDLQPWGDIGAKCFEELKALEEQYVGLWGIAEMAGEWRHRKQPLDLDSYWISAAGHLRLQEQLGPDSGLQNFGSIICIPKIGCIHIGEMLVDKSSRLLNMLRINLEAPWNERISIGSVEIKSRDYRGTSKIIPEKRRAFPITTSGKEQEGQAISFERSGGLDLVPSKSPDESLLSRFLDDPEFVNALEGFRGPHRRALLWTAALQSAFMEQRIWQEVEGFQYASVGLANPDVEENAFALFIYRLPASGGEEKRMLQVGTDRFPIFIRPSLLQLHAIPDVHPVGGTSTCWARSRKPIRNSETALLTAKHVIGDAPLGASVTTTRGKSRVLAIAPGSIDA